MDIEVKGDELRIAGTSVRGRAELAEVLGPSDRSVTTDRTVAGVDDPGEVAIDVWEEHGLMAGDDWVAIAVGPNVLDEPVWPAQRHHGRIVLDGDDLVSVTLPPDPLREDRRVTQVGPWAVTLVVDWDGTPGKLLIRRAPATGT